MHNLHAWKEFRLLQKKLPDKKKKFAEKLPIYNIYIDCWQLTDQFCEEKFNHGRFGVEIIKMHNLLK